MGCTYAVLGFYMSLVDIERPWINAIVPTVGFWLSTLSLDKIRPLYLRCMHSAACVSAFPTDSYVATHSVFRADKSCLHSRARGQRARLTCMLRHSSALEAIAEEEDDGSPAGLSLPAVEP